MRTPALSILALAFCACSSSDDGRVPTYPTNSVIGVLQDAPVDDLESFSIVVTGFDLIDASSGAAAVVGARPDRIELTGLELKGDWFASGLVFDGTYSSARVHFDPTSIEAIGVDGNLVPVSSSVSTFDVFFAAPVSLGGQERLQVIIDLDLDESIRGSIASPPLRFEPRATRIPLDSGTYPLDEFDGPGFRSAAGPSDPLLITGVHNLASTDGGGNTSGAVAVPPAAVDVDSSTVLVDEDGSVFADRAEFFARYANGNFLMTEVRGELRPDGTVRAARIEIEGSPATIGSPSLRSELEGRVLSIDPQTSFELLVVDVENSGLGLGALLAQSTPPHVFTIGFDASTRIVDDNGQTVASADDLAVGQRIDVRIVDSNMPLVADRIELESPPQHRATITDTSGLPGSLLVRMPKFAPAVTSGLVASDSTDVAVDLGLAAVLLSANNNAPIPASALVAGVGVRVSGPVEGTPAAPSIEAGLIEVVAGEFIGTVSGASAAAGTFDVAVSEISSPLGGAAAVPPFSVTVDPSCAFSGAASSQAEFFARFSALGAGQTLRVEVEGLGTSVANEVRAYEIRATVE